MRRLPLLLAAGCLVAVMATPAVADAPGPWVAPLGEPPRVVRAFRPPTERWGAGHRGVDLAGRPRAWVRAAGAGRVSFAGPLAGRGVVVVVHGALRTTYEPLAPSVRVGEQVAAGAPMGRLVAGHDAGRSSAAVLHWGLLRDETYLDPMSLLRGRPVRLLPRWPGPPAPERMAVAAWDRMATPADAAAAPPQVVSAPARPGRSGGPPAAATALTVLAVTGAAAAFARAGPAP